MTRKIVSLLASGALLMPVAAGHGVAATSVMKAPPATAATTRPAPTATVRKAAFGAAAKSEIAYGGHALQRMDFYPGASATPGTPLPTIVFVHGGAWAGGDKSDSTGAAKIRHYTEAGYNLVSVNYRLLPEVAIEDQAADLAAAVDDLLANAKTLGIDRRRVVLMGHSAGAHLSALVATDPALMKARGRNPQDIAGVVLLDGPAYDVPEQIADVGPLIGFGFQVAFGGRVGRQRALSPASHVDTPNAARFLLLHVERPDSTRQARIFAEDLTRAGVDAQVMAFPGRGMDGHNMLNAMLGRSDSPATVPVDKWLAETFRRAG